LTSKISLFPKSGAKVLLFFDMSKFFQKKITIFAENFDFCLKKTTIFDKKHKKNEESTRFG
jgi:hypothetical protein